VEGPAESVADKAKRPPELATAPPEALKAVQKRIAELEQAEPSVKKAKLPTPRKGVRILPQPTVTPNRETAPADKGLAKMERALQGLPPPPSPPPAPEKKEKPASEDAWKRGVDA
jgi:hypothetical protein